MARLTTNLQLTKPELSDTITPTIFADNFDKIDSSVALKSGTTFTGNVSMSYGAQSNIGLYNMYVVANDGSTRVSTQRIKLQRK